MSPVDYSSNHYIFQTHDFCIRKHWKWKSKTLYLHVPPSHFPWDHSMIQRSNTPAEQQELCAHTTAGLSWAAVTSLVCVYMCQPATRETLLSLLLPLQTEGKRWGWGVFGERGKERAYRPCQIKLWGLGSDSPFNTINTLFFCRFGFGVWSSGPATAQARLSGDSHPLAGPSLCPGWMLTSNWTSKMSFSDQRGAVWRAGLR